MKKKVKSKGLSDAQLIEKHEAGKFKPAPVLKTLLGVPNPNISKKIKKK